MPPGDFAFCGHTRGMNRIFVAQRQWFDDGSGHNGWQLNRDRPTPADLKRRSFLVSLACSSRVSTLLVAAALAGPAAAQGRGELLYTAHCSACHSEQIHWRSAKAVTDWTSLKAEVFKWQGMARLAWSEDDVTDVARFLNERIYRFETPLATASKVPLSLRAPGAGAP